MINSADQSVVGGGYCRSFTGVPVNEINAHGQAQVFGWMGLFMMGFAYQAFPRFWHTSLAKPGLAVLTCYLMVGGVLIASLGMALAGHWEHALPCAEFGSLMEVAAVTIFAGQLFCTWKQSGKKLEPYIGYIFTALAWFVVAAAFNAWHTWNTVSAVTREQLLFWVATFQSPLRDVQFHGLAMTMIFGVSLRTLPHLFGLPKISDRRAWLSLLILTASVLIEIILFIAYRLNHNHVFAALLVIPWIMMISASTALILPWKLWKSFMPSERSVKFVRAAFAWLFVSLVMLLLLPAYQFVSQIPFSHAYYGAIRHAITVGFISLMIMGYAARVVPILNGVDSSRLNSLWGPFLLVNIGCFLRVATQTLTDWNHSIFPLVGISGTLEVAGLAWWGLHLTGIMLRGKREMQSYDSDNSDGAQPVGDRPDRVSGDHVVADVLAWYPESEPAFVLFGFTPVLNPVMRRTLAAQVTIAQACQLRGVNEADFLLAINTAIQACQSNCSECACPGGKL